MLTEARLLELIAQSRRQQEACTPRLILKLPLQAVLHPEVVATSDNASSHASERPDSLEEAPDTFEQPAAG
jgi:hypothetical protein